MLGNFLTTLKSIKLLPRFLTIVSAVFVVYGFFIFSAHAATYYVSPSGSDSSSGSSASPFRTIQKAADIVNPGDTVIVRNGTYTGSGTYAVTIHRSGNSSNWITFKAENTWGAAIDGQQSNHSGIGISSGTSYVRIEGLEIKNARSGGISSNSAGVHHMYYYKNLIHHIGGYCTDTTGGIVGFRDDDDTANITYDSNVIHSIGRLHPNDGCNYSTGNYKNHDHGLYINGKNLTIINNIFYNNIRGWSIQASNGADNWVIANNIFADPNPDRDGDIVLWNGNSNITIANNIFYNTRGAMIDVSSCGKSNIVVRDNISTTASVLSGDSCSGFTLTNNRLNTNPSLVNPGGRDYHLRSDSSAINTANSSFAPSKDFDGNSRPQGSGYDVGPFEFLSATTPPPPPPPPPSPSPDTTAPNVSISSPNSGATVSGTITLTATASDASNGTQIVSGVAGVQFRLNGSNLGTQDTSSPYSIAWNTTGVANGTYTLTAIATDNAGNTRTSSSISVTVNNASAPTLTFTASATSIQSGQSSTLSWSSANATSCSASGAWAGSKATSGSQSVSPTSNSTYTLTCTGSGGSINRSVVVSVTVAPPPPPPANQKPTGFLDGITAEGVVFGWAQDPDSSGSAITVHLYFDRNAGTAGATAVPVSAGDFRADVGNHAFNYTIPASLRDGAAHQVWVWGIDLNDASGASNVQLSGSPKSFNIAPPTTPSFSQLYEAESFTLVSSFTKSSDTNALGGMYISAASGQESSSPVRQASHSFNLASGGTYYLWARMMGPNEQSDALYIGIDSSWDRVFFDDVIGSYGWVRVETGINNGQTGFSLSVGTHTFQVGLGELNARLDTLYLTSDPNDVPAFAPQSTPPPPPPPTPPPPAPPPPAPTLTFTASATSIQSGQSSTLSWSSANATSCSASGAWAGSKATSGSQSVSPTSNSTYTLTCTGAGGSINRSVSISVFAPPPPPAPPPTPPPPPAPSPQSLSDSDFEIQTIVSNLKNPWALDFLPDGRLVFTERAGFVKLIETNGTIRTIGAMQNVKDGNESGVMGIAVDPDFSSTRHIFIQYTRTTGNRISRFEFNGTSLLNEFVLIDNIPAASNHDGGRLRFGPDGKLYSTTGDAQNTSLPQNLNSLAGKILRLNKDGSVPSDNPFNSHVWTYGHRNPQGLDWNSTTGVMYSAEHGEVANDEINVVQRGGNYGWPNTECDESGSGVIQPVRCFSEFTLAPSGLAVYNGEIYTAGLRGKQLRRLVLDSNNNVIFQQALFTNFGRLRGIRAYGGWLYFTTSNRDDRVSSTVPASTDDRIFRIRLKTGTPPPPAPPPTPPPPPPPAPTPPPPPPPANQKPTGFLDGITAEGVVFGWAQDPDSSGSAITVHLYFDRNAGTAGATAVPVSAGDFRADVGNHAFNYTIPASLRDGAAHQVWVWGIDLNDASGASNVQLSGSPKSFNIAPPTTPSFSQLYEAESFTLVSPMVKASDASASAGSYITPASGVNSTNPVREASLNINIPASGTYYLWARMMGPAETNDALYVGIGSSWDRIFPSTTSQYEWVRVENGTSGQTNFTLSAGSHTLQVGHGEIDARLDALFLTSNSAQTPPSPAAPPPSTSAPALSFTANPVSITSGQSSALSWSSSNATSCSGSGSWSGSKTVSGSQSVLPTSNATYTLTCTGSGGSVSRSVNVSVSQPVPAPDTTAPLITGIVTSNITPTSVVISWNTNEGSTSQIQYGLTSAYGGLTPVSSNLTTSHSVTLTGLSSGTGYNYRVRSKDNAGNETVSSNFTFQTQSDAIADNIPPGPAKSLRAIEVTATSVKVTFVAPGDDGDAGTAAFYDLRYSTGGINFATFETAIQAVGEPLPAVAGTSETYTLVGLQPNQSYTLAIKTFDEAGNASGLSSVLSFRTKSEPVSAPAPVNQKPTGFLDGVTSQGVVFGWAQDPDSPNSSIQIHLYFDRNAGTAGATPVAVTASDARSDVGNHAFNYTIPASLRDGAAHQVWAWAIDLNDTSGSGNIQLTGSGVSFSISLPPQADKTPPLVSFVGLTPNSIVGGLVTLNTNVQDPVNDVDQVSGIASVQFKLDGINLGSAVDQPPYSLIWDTTLTNNGSHVLSFTASDNAGNVSEDALVSVIVQNATEQTPPDPESENTPESAPDTLPPPGVTQFQAQGLDAQVALSWRNPVASADFIRTVIVRKVGSAPVNVNDGARVFEGLLESYVDVGLTNGERYHYAAFTFDRIPNYSAPATLSAVPVAGKTQTEVTAPVENLPAPRLIKYPDDPTVYLVENGFKRPISDYAVYEKNFANQPIAVVSPTQTYPDGSAIRFDSGTILKTPDAPTIWLITENSSRYPFRSQEEFSRFGFRFDLIRVISEQDLNSYTPANFDSLALFHNTGTFVKYAGNDTVYQIRNRIKHPVTSPAVFFTHALSFREVLLIPDDITYPTGSAITFSDGVLIKGTSTPTVYLIENGTKRAFRSAQALLNMGFVFDQVRQVPDSDLSLNEPGTEI